MTHPSFDELFGGTYLKAVDLDLNPDQTKVVTINATDFQPIGPDRRTKMLLQFKEIEKSLVLNKTNATTISDLYGKDFSEWIGKKIGLCIADVNYQGKTTQGVRVRPRIPKGQIVTEVRAEEDY